MKNFFAIIVTFNGFRWLDKCFGSLTTSTLPVKVIFIDNASTDGTREYIRRHFPQIDLSEKRNSFFCSTRLLIMQPFSTQNLVLLKSLIFR